MAVTYSEGGSRRRRRRKRRDKEEAESTTPTAETTATTVSVDEPKGSGVTYRTKRQRRSDRRSSRVEEAVANLKEFKEPTIDEDREISLRAPTERERKRFFSGDGPSVPQRIRTAGRAVIQREETERRLERKVERARFNELYGEVGVLESLWSSIGSGVLGGTSQIETAIGVGARKLGAERFGENMIQRGRDDRELKRIYDQEYRAYVGDPNAEEIRPDTLVEMVRSGNGLYLANMVAEAAPATAAITASGAGAVAAGAPAAAGAGVAALVGSTFQFGSSYQEVDAFAEETGADISEAQKEGIALRVTATTIPLEFIPEFRVLTRLKGAGATRQIQNAFARNLTKGLLETGQSAVEQGSTEAVTEIGQTVIENAWTQTYNENQDIFEGVTESALVGFSSGGITDSIVSASQATMNGLSGRDVEGQIAEDNPAQFVPAEGQLGNELAGIAEQVRNKVPGEGLTDVAVQEEAVGETTTGGVSIQEEAVAIDELGPVADPIETQTRETTQKPLTKQEETDISSDIDQRVKEVEPFLKKEKAMDEAMFKREEVEPYKEAGELTTTLLKDLEGKTTVSKQYILDLTNQGKLKQVERDLVRDIAEGMEDKINVAEFAETVKQALVPLDIKKTGKFESISLRSDVRGDVADYTEHVYQGPVKTTAGEVHFGGDAPRYFGHSRVEDMANGTTRRVIEVQSDLFQKGRMDTEQFRVEKEEATGLSKKPGSEQSYVDFTIENNFYPREDVPQGRVEENATLLVEQGYTKNDVPFFENLLRGAKELQKDIPGSVVAKNKIETLDLVVEKLKSTQIDKTDITKLKQYKNPTAHFRMVREEIKRAAQDGKTEVLFPTGETAMAIEGLGETSDFIDVEISQEPLTADQISVGQEVFQGTPDIRWVVTEVLEDGKFKAAPKHRVSKVVDGIAIEEYYDPISGTTQQRNVRGGDMETFDISGTVDEQNPIYKFYEKTLAKYLKNNYDATRITDDQGMDWMRVPIKEEYGTEAVTAFKKEAEPVKRVSATVGVEKIKSYQKRLGVSFPVLVYNKLYTGEVVAGMPVQAYGMYLDGTITLAETITQYTADHEIGHFAFRNLDTMPIFKGLSKESILSEARKKYGLLSNSSLEEHIMEDFEVYAAQQEESKKTTFTGKIKQFFEKLYNMLKDMMNLTNDEFTSITRFYDSLYYGKKSGSGVITFKGTGKATEFMKQRFENFGEPQPSFKRVDDSEFIPDDELSQWAAEQEFYSEIRQEIDNMPVAGNVALEFQMIGEKLVVMRDSIDINPAKSLSKYASKSGEFKGMLSEVGGKDGKGSKWELEGDSIANEMGYYDVAQARSEYDSYLKEKERYSAFKEEYKSIKEQYKDAKAIESASKRQAVLDRKMKAEIKRKQRLINRGIRKGIAKGKKIGKAERDAQYNDMLNSMYLEKDIQNRKVQLYRKNLIDALRTSIPPKERGKFTGRIANVGASETRMANVLLDIYQRKAHLDIVEGTRADEAAKRKHIGFLRKIYDIEPSLILDVKKTLNFRDTYKRGEKTGQEKEALKSIKKMDMIELGMFIDELNTRIEFRKNNPVNYLDTMEVGAKKSVLARLMEGLDKFEYKVFAPVERSLKKISNAIYEQTLTVFANIDFNKVQHSKKMKPILDVFSEATPKDQELMKIYGQSSEEGKMRSIIEQYRSKEETDQILTDVREVLDELHAGLKDVGVEVPYRGFYFPRKLKVLERENTKYAIDVVQKKLGRKLSIEERAHIVENLIRGFDVSRLPFVSLSGRKFEAERKLETIDEDTSPLYEDFSTALLAYVEGANITIEQRRFFGKSNFTVMDPKADLENSIALKVDELFQKGAIEQKDMDRLKDIFNTIFVAQASDTHKMFMRFANLYLYPAALGQLTSGVTQLKDFSLQVIVNDVLAGNFNTLGGIVVGGLQVDPKEMGLTDSLRDIEGLSKVDTESKFIRAVEKLGNIVTSPVGIMDSSALRVFVNGTYQRMIKLAKKDSKKFRSYMEEVYGKQHADQLINEWAQLDPREVKATREIARFIYGEVSKTRPVTRLQKARGAIRHPSFYILMNFTIKQLEFIRNNSFDIISQGVRTKDAKMVAKGMGTLVTMFTVLAMFGAPVDWLKDWMKGTAGDKSMWQRILDNLMNPFGLSTYDLWAAKREGYFTQAAGVFTPAGPAIIVQVLEDARKDMVNTITGEEYWADARSFKRLPFVGNIYDKRFGGGS